MFHHILVPLDGTERAEQAISFAARIARATDATVILLNVLEVTPEHLAYLMAVGMQPQEIIDTDQQKGMSYLAHVSTSPCLRDLPVELKLCFGTLSEFLVDDTEMERIDLIVMFNHGHTDTKHLVSGSVALYTSHHGLVPVFLLHEQQAERNVQHPFRILVALDGSKRAEATLRPAAALSVLLSAPEPGSLYLLYTVRPTIVAHDFYSEEIMQHTKEEASKMAQAYLNAVIRKMFREIICNFPLHISSSICYDQSIPASNLVGLLRGKSGLLVSHLSLCP